MDLGLTDKIALVTGASKGIGRAIALGLAREGMHIAVSARTESQLESLANEIQSLSRQCLVLPTDLSHPEAPASVLAQTIAGFQRLDLLVNNAGATKRGDFLELTEADWAAGFGLKFFAAVRLSRLAWPYLGHSRGSIVNIAGVGGRAGSAEFTIGGSVNAAMLNLTKCLADRGVRDHVRVNAINPGSIVTDRLTMRIEKLAAEKSVAASEAAALMTEQQKIARFGTPEEIAQAVAFLASEKAAYIQGALLDIDGGLTRAL